MVKVNKKHHIRKKGPGQNKLRKNPTRGKFGPKHKEKVFRTMFLQDKGSGLLRGRKRVEGAGDGTGVIREGGVGRIIGRVESKGKKYNSNLNKVRYS